jgi:hypothetical protein
MKRAFSGDSKVYFPAKRAIQPIISLPVKNFR